MTKSPRKNVPDVGIELGAACMLSELASEPATAPGQKKKKKKKKMVLSCPHFPHNGIISLWENYSALKGELT